MFHLSGNASGSGDFFIRAGNVSAQRNIWSKTLYCLDLEEKNEKVEKQGRQRSVSRDFIDIYLEKMEETKDENSSFYGPQGLANLQVPVL